jgi:hypothetical protein
MNLNLCHTMLVSIIAPHKDTEAPPPKPWMKDPMFQIGWDFRHFLSPGKEALHHLLVGML